MTTYNKQKVDDRLDKILKKEQISERNKKLLQKFIRYLRAEDATGSRRNHKYLSIFDSLFENYINFDLDTATKDQMRGAIGEIQAADYSDWWKADRKTALKKFYNTLWEEEMDRPDNIQRIVNAKFLKKGKIERANEIEALTPEEVMKMSEEGLNARDRLMPLFFFETGARIGEILDIKLEDLEMTEKYAVVEVKTLKNDKGPRELALTDCIQLLQHWLEQHPAKDNPEAPLFVNLNAKGTGGYAGKKMNPSNTSQILKKLAHKAGIDKKINNHVFRHSSATHKGETWGLNRLMYWHGWKSSDVATDYLRENEKRMKKARLEEAGIESSEEESNVLERRSCGRCGETWPPTQDYCGDCGMSLSKGAADKVRELEEAGKKTAKMRMNGLSEEELVKKLEDLGVIG
ncbi:MAG: tyrosine-type recombinase/integrase [Candidatus Nanohaloarchaea archaeon]